jgi:hypothetical protein
MAEHVQKLHGMLLLVKAGAGVPEFAMLDCSCLGARCVMCDAGAWLGCSPCQLYLAGLQFVDQLLQ